MKNAYQPIEAKIVDIIEETPNIKTFCLVPEQEFEFKTGQFIELTYPGVGEAPFTPSSSPQVKDKFDVTIMNVGRVTSLLHQAQKDQMVGIRGPFGQGYPLEKFKDREVLIVGGGVGLAPLRSLFLSLIAEIDQYKKIIFRYGARTPKDLVYKQDLLGQWAKTEGVDLMVTVDQGDETWSGHVGLVTTILDDLKIDLSNSVAVVCGPPIMMKFVTFKLLDIGYKPADIYLSMEKNMSCGVGKCGHCMIGKYYACKDGPVFTYDQIKDAPNIWD